MNWRPILSPTIRHTRLLAMGLGTLITSSGVLSCSADANLGSNPEANPDVAEFEQVEEAVTQAAPPDSCGYQVTSLYHSRRKQDGFYGLLELKNVSGPKATTFQVLADLHGATPSKCLLADCKAVEGGYMFTPPRLFSLIGLRQGQSYPLPYVSKDNYQNVTPYVISVNGKICDQVAPTVSLAASGGFFTGNSTLTLTATASDNVAVKKVVFSRDGQVIGTDLTAPYALSVPISATDNGRHKYTATAYDMSGNTTTSASKSALVAIGNKFFGTAPTDAADYAGLLAYFNQVTPGNAGKWGTVEATRNVMNFTDLDIAYTFAKNNGLPFKLHTLVWGQQQPAWLSSLTQAEQLAEINEWFAALAARYPDAAQIDVVNEPLHAPPSYIAALGGAGTTGWDWVIKSFELARTHFPNAELLLNEYYVLPLASTTADYVNIINLLKARGLIDGIGEQGHFYERAELPVLSANLNALTATGLPLYITELDINFANDARQAVRMSELFPIFWSNPSVLGITHWGYRQGNMWRTDAYLQRTDGSERPALTWIQCYRAGGTNCPVPTYVPEARTGDSAGITLQAEDYDAAEGLLAAGDLVAYTDNGDWLNFDRVAFDNNWNSLSVKYAQGGTNPVSLTVHVDSLDNAPVATLNLAPTGGWNTLQTVSIPWAPLSGEHKLFVRFGGGANVDSFQFSAPSGLGANLVANSDFEVDSATGWSSWGGGTIATSTARALSGNSSLAMTGRNGNSPLVYNLSVTPGKTYKASLWASIGGTASAQANVTTSVQCADGSGPGFTWLGSAQTITDGQWVEFTGDLVIPDCPLGWIAFWLEGPGAGVDLYLDHVSVRPVTQTTTNVVANGTFESGTTGWGTWNSGVLTASTARAHSGTRSLLVSDRASNAPAAIDLTSVVSRGHNYPVSIWAAIDSADNASQAINVTRMVECDGTPSYSWLTQATIADNGQWVELTGTLDVTDCNVTKVLLWVEGGTADLYLDDVRVVVAAAPANLIPDGTFEAGQGGWFGWGNAGLGVVNTSAHAGTQSLKGTSMTSGAIARDIRSLVTAGMRYQATAWVSVDSLAAGSGAVRFQTAAACNGGGTSYPWLMGVTVANGAWQQVTGVVDLSACTSVEQLQLFVGADEGDLYVDDVTLTLIP